jgi:hypothetical protein
MSHTRLCDVLPFHSLQAQNFSPAALKLRMMGVRRHIIEVDKNAVFPPVGPGCFQELHPFILMRWEENLTQRFSNHPYQRDADTACKETNPSF